MRLTDEERAANAPAPETVDFAVKQVMVNGYVLLEGVLPPDFVRELRTAFMDVFNAYIARVETNRGTNRYQMHLPFRPPFNDPRVIENPFILPIVDAIIGRDAICHYFASDTPLPGSDYQAVHSDIYTLFPEAPDVVVPPYCLVLNIPLVDFTPQNGPLEIWPGGTHLRTPDRATMQELAEVMPHEPVLMPAGSLLLRDARMWHRGTPNRADHARPNMALIYSYHWCDAGYDRVGIPREIYEGLSERARHLFRLENIGGALANEIR